MRNTNSFRFDSRHGQIIETAGRTAPPTLQTFRMDLRDRIRLFVDLAMQIA